jgi:hypothetical protein
VISSILRYIYNYSVHKHNDSKDRIPKLSPNYLLVYSLCSLVCGHNIETPSKDPSFMLCVHIVQAGRALEPDAHPPFPFLDMRCDDKYYPGLEMPHFSQQHASIRIRTLVGIYQTPNIRVQHSRDTSCWLESVSLQRKGM